MYKNFAFTALAASCCLTAAPTWAASIPSYQMEEIIVTAAPPAAAVTSDSIDSKYVSPGRYASVPELLQYTVGISGNAALMATTRMILSRSADWMPTVTISCWTTSR